MNDLDLKHLIDIQEGINLEPSESFLKERENFRKAFEEDSIDE